MGNLWNICEKIWTIYGKRIKTTGKWMEMDGNGWKWMEWSLNSEILNFWADLGQFVALGWLTSLQKLLVKWMLIGKIYRKLSNYVNSVLWKLWPIR